MNILIVCTNRQRRKESIWRQLEEVFGVKSTQPDAINPKKTYDVAIAAGLVGSAVAGRWVSRGDKTLAEIIAEVNGESSTPLVDPGNAPVDPDEDTPSVATGNVITMSKAAGELIDKHDLNPAEIPFRGPKITKPDVEAFLQQ